MIAAMVPTVMRKVSCQSAYEKSFITGTCTGPQGRSKNHKRMNAVRSYPSSTNRRYTKVTRHVRPVDLVVVKLMEGD